MNEIQEGVKKIYIDNLGRNCSYDNHNFMMPKAFFVDCTNYRKLNNLIGIANNSRGEILRQIGKTFYTSAIALYFARQEQRVLYIKARTQSNQDNLRVISFLDNKSYDPINHVQFASIEQIRNRSFRGHRFDIAILDNEIIDVTRNDFFQQSVLDNRGSAANNRSIVIRNLMSELAIFTSRIYLGESSHKGRLLTFGETKAGLVLDECKNETMNMLQMYDVMIDENISQLSSIELDILSFPV